MPYIDIDLDDFSDSDLIKELVARGYVVNNHDDSAWYQDKIFELYKEWLADEGDSDRRFDRALRAFFSVHLNRNV